MPHVELPQAEFKVVMLGDTNTGKTSLVLRFAEGYYREEARSATVGAFFMTKRLQVSGLTCKIQIWDTAGQSQFRAMAPMYYKNAAAAIVCYDTTNADSYDTMRYWLDELHRNVAAGSIVICMCATKSDLEPRAISHRKAQELAQAMGAMWVDTSAKNNTNVTELFRQVAERVLRFREKAKMYSSEDKIPVTPGASIDEQGRVVKRGQSYGTPSGTPNPNTDTPIRTPHGDQEQVPSSSIPPGISDLSSDGGIPMGSNGGRNTLKIGGSSKPSRRRRKNGSGGASTTMSVQSTDSDGVQARTVASAICEPILCGALSSSSTEAKDGEGGDESLRGCVII